MALGVASTAAQPISQGILQTLQLQQAQRTADRAQRQAQALQAEADAAQHSADQAADKASNLNRQARDARNSADKADRNLTSMRSLSNVQADLGKLSDNVKQAVRTLETPPAAPVVNTQGQVTGTVINVTA